MRALSTLILASALSGCGLLPPADIPTPPQPGAPAAVFDIDGTLTPGVFQVFTARPDAARAVQLHAGQGHAIVYLSTRIHGLQAGIPAWLRRHGFPPGPVHVPQSEADYQRPEVFKAGVLERYQHAGWRFVAAYGDSSTDFDAYRAAGIAQERVHGLRREGAAACQPGPIHECLDGWTGQLSRITQRP